MKTLTNSTLIVIAFSVLTLLIACAPAERSDVWRGARELTKAQQEEKLADANRYFKDKQYEQALSIIEPLAKIGNSHAQYSLGYMYYYGKGVKLNQELGIEWISKAAAQEHDNAKIALAILNDETTSTENTASAEQKQTNTIAQNKTNSKATAGAIKPIAKAQANNSDSTTKAAASKTARTSKDSKDKQDSPSTQVTTKLNTAIKTTLAKQVNPTNAPVAQLYGPTKQFDTLWSIARAVRPNKTISITKMMNEIVAANPHAFVKDNKNVLKANVVLKIPAITSDGAAKQQPTTAKSEKTALVDDTVPTP